MTITVGELVSFGPQAGKETKKGGMDEAVLETDKVLYSTTNLEIPERFLFHSNGKALGKHNPAGLAPPGGQSPLITPCSSIYLAFR